MLNITLATDCHSDFSQKKIFWQDGDVLMLAGDTANSVGPTLKFVSKAARHFKRVFLICGNHEHYANRTQKRTIEDTEDAIARGLPGNATLLCARNPHEEYQGVHFVGMTGWYSFDAAGDPIQNRAKWNDEMNDALNMGFDKYGLPLIEQPTIWDRAESEAQLMDEVLTGLDDKPIVVMTHMPCVRKFLSWKADPYWNMKNAYYMNCHMEKVAERHTDRVSLWLSGHVHQQNSIVKGRIWFVSNPRGYPSEQYGREWEPLRVSILPDGTALPC